VALNHLDDQELIKRIIGGHDDALGELYDRYSRLVFTIALNVVGNAATAEEITLDVFTSVWEKAGTYQGNLAKVTTWVTRMARNRSIDILRREAVRPQKYSVSWSDIGDQPISSDNPEAEAALDLQKRRVRQAVATLPDEQKEVISLAYFRGYSHSQIAEALELPLGTVKGRIRGGMQRLRAELGDIL